MTRTLSALCVLLIVATALAPVSAAGAATGATTSHDCSFPVTMTDASGTDVTLEERPDRVTTLNPSAAQTMWALDAESQVVGRTKFAAYLEGAETRTNVSAAGGFGVSVEKVVGTNPDLVLAPNTTSAETVTALRDAGLTVYQFALAEDIDDVAAKTTTIGRLTGNCEAAARTNAWMTANVDAARQATADVDRPRVLYPLGSGFVANTNTFISAMITASGGTNVMAETNLSRAYPQVSDEVILELDPEVLVITETNRYLLAQQPYNATTAGRMNQTVFVDANYLNQPAPRSVVYAVRNLTTGLHPDAAASAEFVAKSEVTVATETPPPTDATFTATPTEPEPTPTTAPGQPGLGVVPALLALAAIALLSRRD
ncbi:PGF-CTERM-anchored ABC transporter substrate-binding protein [Halosegnis sp.]|uniref:PGF-CTERM-anchored ABC transporter substrate-binding protein n=1 Tax=Halosegnis sp. TaxID=2864959 RepID=UPI0035D42711